MGNTSPKQIRETWIGAGRRAYKVGAFITISREDLKKIWIINTAKKLYFEDDLVTEEKKPEPPRPFRIQEAGWGYYEPRFEYTVRDGGEEQTINGLACRKYVAEGLADYAQETREMWISRQVPIDLVRYNEKIMYADKEPVWQALFKAFPSIRPALSVRTRVVTEPSIAPTMTWNFELTKIESAEPPAGTYEIPAGFAKAATRDELYRR
jgi:hypothetical protein